MTSDDGPLFEQRMTTLVEDTRMNLALGTTIRTVLYPVIG